MNVPSTTLKGRLKGPQHHLNVPDQINTGPNKLWRSPPPITAKENVLKPMESKTEPYVNVYSLESEHALAPIEGRVKGTQEWS